MDPQRRVRELAAEKHELFKKFTRVDKKFMTAIKVLQQIAQCDSLKTATVMAESAIKQLPINHDVDQHTLILKEASVNGQDRVETALKKPSVPSKKGGTKHGPRPKGGASLW